MNERIRELLDEALGSIDPMDQNANVFEKFAELIVLECIKQGDALVKHYINTHTEQDQALLLACIADYTNQIKKHFGVE